MLDLPPRRSPGPVPLRRLEDGISRNSMMVILISGHELTILFMLSACSIACFQMSQRRDVAISKYVSRT